MVFIITIMSPFCCRRSRKYATFDYTFFSYVATHSQTCTEESKYAQEIGLSSWKQVNYGDWNLDLDVGVEEKFCKGEISLVVCTAFLWTKTSYFSSALYFLSGDSIHLHFLLPTSSLALGVTFHFLCNLYENLPFTLVKIHMGGNNVICDLPSNQRLLNRPWKAFSKN